MSWRERATCREYSPETWFPDDLPTSMKNRITRQAKAICETCPVTAECLDEARDIEGGSNGRGRYGIRGGLTPMERAKLGPLPQPCVECGELFTPSSSQAILCSADCRKRRHNRQKNERERERNERAS